MLPIEEQDEMGVRNLCGPTIRMEIYRTAITETFFKGLDNSYMYTTKPLLIIYLLLFSTYFYNQGSCFLYNRVFCLQTAFIYVYIRKPYTRLL